MVNAPSLPPHLLPADDEPQALKRALKQGLIFLALAILVHIGLLIVITRVPLGPAPPARVAVENWDRSQVDALKKSWKNEKSLVLAKDVPASKEAPENARYESDRNRIVDRETRAERTDVLPRAGRPGQSTTDADARASADLSRLGVGLGPAPRPRSAPRSQQGSSGADQALPDSRLPMSAENALNTQESKYYSFYSRLYQAIAPVWQSEIRRASTFKRVSEGTYVTAADVVLDERGNLIEVRIVESSGVPEFDEAVQRAWRRIGRFPNPPRDLLDSHGQAHTGWTFFVNVDASFNLRYVAPERNY